jgi:hypothetical protein
VSRLQPPQTFAEGMRLLFAIAALAAGFGFGLGAVAIVAVLVWGGWPPALYEKIIGILGIVAIGALVLVGLTQIGILLGGPVGRFKGSVSKTGLDFEASDSDAPIAPATVAAAAQGAASGAVSAAAAAPVATEPLPRP